MRGHEKGLYTTFGQYWLLDRRTTSVRYSGLFGMLSLDVNSYFNR